MSSEAAQQAVQAMIESYRIVSEEPETVDIGATLDGVAVERLATEYARLLAPEGVPHDQAFLRVNTSVLSGLPIFDDLMKLTLQEAADRVVCEASRELGLLPLDDPFVRLLDGDMSDVLNVMITIPVLRGVPVVDASGLEVRYHPVVKSGDEVDARIEEACGQYQVSTAEELIDKTGLYPSAERMRAALDSSLDAHIAGLNERSQREAACDALLKACTFEVPQKMLDSYVDREMRGIVNGMGAQAFEEQLEAQGMTEDGFRADMAAQLVDALRLEIILDSLALQKEHLVTDEERLAKIRQRVAQQGATQQDRAQAAQDMLQQIKAVPARLRSLDKDIRRDAALGAALAQAQLTALAPMTTEEFTRLDRASMPRR